MRTTDASGSGRSARRQPGRGWAREARRTGNPLLREPSAGERAVARLAVAGFALLVLATLAACVLGYQRGRRAERVEGISRHPVTATVVGPVDSELVGNMYLVDLRVRVSYRFAGADRVAAVATGEAPSVGSALHLWVDADGQVTRAPQSRWDTARQTALAALLGMGLLLLVGTGGRVGLDAWRLRRHFADWDLEWLQLDSGRH